MVTFTYSIQNNFPNHVVAPDRLTLEISQVITDVVLINISTAGDVCTINFSGDLTAGDQASLDRVVAAHSGIPLPVPVTQVSLAGVSVLDGKLSTVSWPTKGTRQTQYTFNWCDKTTWYRDAARVDGEVATDSGDHLTYSLAHQFVIDAYHGKLSSEDFLVDANGHNYRVTVRSDGVVKTEQDPHTGTGGDYTINYAAGTITFLVSQGSAAITATYHYAQTSKFILAPSAGKDLELVRVEVQFTKDIEVTDSVRFMATALVGPGGSRIPVVQPTVYKTMFDWLNDCDGNYPVMPAFGGGTWRGLPQDMLTIPWNYAAVIELISAYGAQIEISLDHDVPFGGTSATATFYCLEHEADH
jgi:hypothetical protein